MISHGEKNNACYIAAVAACVTMVLGVTTVVFIEMEFMQRKGFSICSGALAVQLEIDH